MGDVSSPVDLNSYVDSILVRSLPRTTTGFISRVSEELRKGNECHYTPTTVAIGPLHADLALLQATNELKLLYFKFFVSRLQGGPAGVKDLIQVVKDKEVEARGSYGDAVELGRDDFVKMLLIDGCFIIELFLRYDNRNNLKEEDDPIFQGGRPRWTMLFDLQKDLILLENQIPYSLLEALYQKCPDNNATLSSLAHCFLSSIMPKDRTSSISSSMSRSRHLASSVQTELPVKAPAQTLSTSADFVCRNLTPTVAIRDFKDHRDPGKMPYLNLLDFVWNDFMPKTYSQERNHSNQGAKCESIGIPCASEMELYGVKFERQKAASLIEVQFKRGVMKMPCMVFRETTITLFLNLLAMEQIPSNKPRPLFFTSYVFFMDSLIRSEKDVELLCRSGVIRSRVNDLKEIGRLFNNLSMNTSIDNLESINLREAYKHVNEYCSSGIWRFRAYLVRNYYDVRWDILMSLLLLILTVTQTVFSVLQYNQKKG